MTLVLMTLCLIGVFGLKKKKKMKYQNNKKKRLRCDLN